MDNNKPFEILAPKQRWFPSRDQLKLVDGSYDKLLPPLVQKIREAVFEWRESDYKGAMETSKALLNYWFRTEHKLHDDLYRFYFAQREAIESIIYLYDVANAHNKADLIRYDSSERISLGMFDETWTRYVIKMATGTGKTKVMALALVWAYFHNLYEENSKLSKNFLIIAPNIIVLNRLRKDFDGLRIYREEPVIPEDGFGDKNWKSDFQLTLHIQDELKPITTSGNLFLTNIHRVYLQEDAEPSIEEEFLGKKPKPDADTSKGLDLGKILRSERIKDLIVFNDEAHHIHDPALEWFKSIEDISNKMKLKYGHGISLQVDFTATPKHNNGAIFVQTICDYPLVEAIHQNVVKSPVLPDEASRAKIEEKTSNEFVERYRDFIHLGYIEWEKQYKDLKSVKIPILFIMTTETTEADQTASWLEQQYPMLKGKVLTIHTNNSGEIKETGRSRKDKEELERLRKAADDIDKELSPYFAVVSVLMLREGWDVRNVSTIVGLRPYKSEAKILPEQTLGRGLRKMFPLDIKEELVVIGTTAFIEFVESLKTEGIDFEYRPMGLGIKSKNPLIVEIDNENKDKNLDELDMEIPLLSPRIYREYKNLEEIDIEDLEFAALTLKKYSEKELKQIVFKDLDGNISHTTEFSDTVPDWRSVVSFFTANILKENRLVSGFNILYPRVESFIRRKMFGKTVQLEDHQTIRNLSEIDAGDCIYTTFKKAINKLTVKDKGTAKVKNYIKLRETHPKVVDNCPYVIPQKSVFKYIIGDSNFELSFAAFLDKCPDIISFAKNTTGENGVNFKMEYQGEDNNIHEYFPDFFIKKTEKEIFIAETKGREDLDDLRKIRRLFAWCQDMNQINTEKTFTALYIKQEEWEKWAEKIKTFADIIKLFEVKDESLR